MNYRHIYHAGNACDVVKHAVLTLWIERLKAKDKGFAVLDTHAGLGLYNLGDPRAQKTNEAEQGARRYVQAGPIPALAAYDAVLKGLNPGGGLTLYPGSPLLVRKLLRPQDRLMACELHPEDAAFLKRLFEEDGAVQVHHRDGYEAMKALWPPAEKRGLVFIDPPFETPDERARLTKALAALHARAPQLGVLVWYPIKNRPALWQWQEELLALGLPKLWRAEWLALPELRGDRLNGSGFLMLNPPFGLEEEGRAVFSALHEALQTEAKGVLWEQLGPLP